VASNKPKQLFISVDGNRVDLDPLTAREQAIDEIYRMMRQAIIDKDIVVASYRSPVWEMCPHVIGKKNGRLQAFLYQFVGERSVSIKKSTGEWHTASNHSAVQTCVDEIDVKVEIGNSL
jgi:hypothetical protein